MQRDQSDRGERGSLFPATRWSAVVGARSPDAEERSRSVARLVEAYWKPAYRYLRVRWRADDEEAQDLVQGFLAQALEKDLFARYDPDRAAFRTWLRLVIDGHVGNERKAARRHKRGGSVTHVPLDFAGADQEMRGVEPEVPDDVDAFFEREWIRHLFALAVGDLRKQSAGKPAAFAAFELHDLAPDAENRPSYAGVAAELGVPVTTVTNWLHQMRRAFRSAVLTRLRELCVDEAEFRREARGILGEAP